MKEPKTGRLPLNLQFFAEGEGGAGTAPESTGGSGKAAPQEAPGAEPAQNQPARTADLNALLAGDKALQSQFDKLVSKALDTAKSRWEAEKNMTAEELARQRAGEREAELAAREEALIRRELRASALGLLGERGLPVELIDCVSVADEDAMLNSLEKAEKAFRGAVNQAVAQRMRGSAPQAAQGNAQAERLAAVRAAAGLKN
ncbi:MAG: DUF4355 domain-containing protein [Candidatus Limiplasma sp.]|nr:DUF4355 domain-containing protein [Candidatus Limiplasma sp.]